MEFKIEKLEKHTLIQVLEEKLDTNVAPSLKSELVLISGKGEKLCNVCTCENRNWYSFSS